VADNGPGIPDDFAAELFNPFQSSKQEGMGLGLSLCHTMVEAHGGHLTLEKHDSTACDFLIRLPKTAKRGEVRRFQSIAPTRKDRNRVQSGLMISMGTAWWSDLP